jgi:DNA-binding FadR family transcriptional regulator
VRAKDEITGILVRERLSAELTDVLDARAGMEAASARLAAAHATPPALAVLEAALAARADAHRAGDPAAYVAADAAFHRGVVQAGGNRLLLRLYDAVGEVLTASMADTTVFPEDPHVRDSHGTLLEAIRAGDAAGAAAASYGLIESVKSSLGGHP